MALPIDSFSESPVAKFSISSKFSMKASSLLKPTQPLEHNKHFPQINITSQKRYACNCTKKNKHSFHLLVKTTDNSRNAQNLNPPLSASAQKTTQNSQRIIPKNT